jgi:hypothetical protein
LLRCEADVEGVSSEFVAPFLHCRPCGGEALGCVEVGVDGFACAEGFA